MQKKNSGLKKLNGKAFRIAIIATRYNEQLMEEFLKNTKNSLLDCGVLAKNIEIFRVPGALELPLVALKLALNLNDNAKFDAIIALGIVIKGETAHFEFVSENCYRGLMEVSLGSTVPVVFGVLTAYTLRQIQDRVSVKIQNKGKEFAETAVEMASLMK